MPTAFVSDHRWYNTVTGGKSHVQVDPSIGRNPLRDLGGGASDAQRGQRTSKIGAASADESAFEPLDSILLRRLRLTTLGDAATSVSSFADAQELTLRARMLLRRDGADEVHAHDALATARLRDLLSGA